MSDPKKPDDSTDAKPEAIGDEELEDVEGGWSFSGTMQPSFEGTQSLTLTGLNADTIYAGSEDLLGSDLLRKRPGRLKDGSGF